VHYFTTKHSQCWSITDRPALIYHWQTGSDLSLTDRLWSITDRPALIYHWQTCSDLSLTDLLWSITDRPALIYHWQTCSGQNPIGAAYSIGGSLPLPKNPTSRLCLWASGCIPSGFALQQLFPGNNLHRNFSMMAGVHRIHSENKKVLKELSSAPTVLLNYLHICVVILFSCLFITLICIKIVHCLIFV